MTAAFLCRPVAENSLDFVVGKENTLSCCNRRNFLTSCALAGAVLETGLLNFSVRAAAGVNLADVKRKDTIVAGTDQVAVDAYGAILLGLKPEEISCVVEGDARGLGTMHYEALKPSIIEI
jgi:hypothetical protein